MGIITAALNAHHLNTHVILSLQRNDEFYTMKKKKHPHPTNLIINDE
jgi:hypothetical protein